MYIYTLKVINGRNKRNTKTVEVPGNMTLEILAKNIVSSFGFGFDHMFAFTSNLTDPYGKAIKLFEAFVDYADDYTEGAKSVKEYYVDDAFEKVGERMQFLFDYGDDWRFFVEVLAKKEVIRTSKNMFVLVSSAGTDPEQYPDLDEEEE